VFTLYYTHKLNKHETQTHFRARLQRKCNVLKNKAKSIGNLKSTTKIVF